MSPPIIMSAERCICTTADDLVNSHQSLCLLHLLGTIGSICLYLRLFGDKQTKKAESSNLSLCLDCAVKAHKIGFFCAASARNGNAKQWNTVS